VDQIAATHAIHQDVPYVVLAGTLTSSGTSKAFVYVYDYNACKVKVSLELPAVNKGFHDVITTGSSLLLIGYIDDGQKNL
jgi:hypothetical protein